MNNPPEEIGILIAEDHPIFRVGLRKVLEAQPGFCVVGEAVDGEQALELARQLKPKILLLDTRMPRVSGLDVLRELKTSADPVCTLIMTAGLERAQIAEAFQQGARGIFLKHCAPDVLLEGIRSVLAGQYWVCGESVPDVAQAIRGFKPFPDTIVGRPKFCLTRRETEVIALIEDGYTNKDIAKKLNLSVLAVQDQLIHIFDKLGVANRLELVLFSIDYHLTESLRTNTT